MPETIFLFVYKQGDLLMAAYLFSENQGSIARVLALLEAYNRRGAAALGFFPCATASPFKYTFGNVRRFYLISVPSKR